MCYLKNYCKFDATFLNSQCKDETFYYAAVRGVYSHMRTLIKPEHLIKIEHQMELTNAVEKKEDSVK